MKVPRTDRLLPGLDIPGLTGSVYAELTEADIEFKPLSRLPADLHVVKEEFRRTYASDYSQLPPAVRDSYHHVYGELAFFLDDPIADRCESIVRGLVKAFQGRMSMSGIPLVDEKVVDVRRHGLVGAHDWPRERLQIVKLGVREEARVGDLQEVEGVGNAGAWDRDRDFEVGESSLSCA